MKILFITAFPPNRMTAGQNYTRNLLDDLSVLHDVELIYFDYSDHTIELNKIQKIKKRKASIQKKIINCLKLFFVHPFFSSRFSLSLWFYIYRNQNKFDLIYFDFSQVFIYNCFIKRKRVVVMSHDVIFQKFNRRKKIIDIVFGNFVRFWEEFLLRRASKILVFSDKDAELIYANYKLKSETVDFYIEKDIKEINHYEIAIKNEFCFYGAWNREENLEGLSWFIKNVLPKTSKFNFVILGGSMPENYKAEINNYSNMRYLGFVNNPYPIIAASQALIAPIFNGAGVKVKVLESLCSGTAVLGTDVAFEGIKELEKIKDDIFYCNDANSFIETLNRFTLKNADDKISLKNNFIYPKKKAIDILLINN